MNSKKGQSEVITTVLIILLVLAAIIIVWQVVQGTLKQGQTDINTKRDCIGLDMVVLKANNATATNNILVRREGTSTVTGGVQAKILINDKLNDTSTVNLDTAYSTATFNEAGLKSGIDQVQAVGILPDGTPCGLSEKVTVTAA